MLLGITRQLGRMKEMLSDLRKNAAMSAEGVSTIQNIDQIDRGYKDIDGRLNAP